MSTGPFSRSSVLAGALALAALSLVPSTSQAFERQWHAGGGIGYVGLKRGDFTGAAIGVELDLTYGLSDMFNLMAEASLSPHHLSGDVTDAKGQTSTVSIPATFDFTSVAVGIAYTLDVLQWVPYAGLMIGGERLSRGSGTLSALNGKEGAETRLDGIVAAGLDYQMSRSVSFGLAARVHVVFNPGDTTDVLQLFLRAAYTWGY